MVVLKMQVTNVDGSFGTDGKLEHQDITLRAVTADCPENKSWSKWTPSGELKFRVTNPDVFGQLVKGGQYYVQLQPVL